MHCHLSGPYRRVCPSVNHCSFEISSIAYIISINSVNIVYVNTVSMSTLSRDLLKILIRLGFPDLTFSDSKIFWNQRIYPASSVFALLKCDLLFKQVLLSLPVCTGRSENNGDNRHMLTIDMFINPYENTIFGEDMNHIWETGFRGRVPARQKPIVKDQVLPVLGNAWTGEAFITMFGHLLGWDLN